ncbi:helix-turn-helix domain-containing protein (plasmid) [Microtetraspora malaysiensis]|uniref:helix-turn-helix domain-containing protein n=1 Tax=Microtetraspora malaysiensis TaxID=161358 RepID=UPI003D938027
MTAEDIPASWWDRAEQSEIWIDGDGQAHRIPEMEPEYSARCLDWLSRNAAAIVATMLDQERRTPMPDLDTVAHDSVAGDSQDAAMVENPHAWMGQTELVFALRVQAGFVPVVRARITMALNARNLYGAKVDRALGVEEPTVDWWEEGKAVPTAAQVRRLAEYTNYPLTFFYTPLDKGGPIGWMCVGHGRARRRIPIDLNPPPRAQAALF